MRVVLTISFEVLDGAEIVVIVLAAISIQLCFPHRYLICKLTGYRSNKKCKNKLCDYYGNGECEYGMEW